MYVERIYIINNDCLCIMNILVISQFYSPEPFQKLKDLCEGFMKSGHVVTVLTGVPNYPTGTIPFDYQHGKKRREYIEGVEILRLPLIPRRRSNVGLALNYLSWSAAATIKILFWKERFDVVFCYQTSPVLVLFPAWLAKLKSRCSLVGYCLDQWPVSMLTTLKSERSLAYRLMKVVSGWLYRRCDSLAVTSEPFIDYLLKEHQLSKDRMIYVPQHGNDDYLSEDFAKSRDDGVVHLLFTGNMGRAQDLGTILKAAKLVRPDLNFVIDFVGSGSALADCESFVQQESLANRVKFHGRKPYTELPQYYRQADACLVTLRHENAIGLTLPGKMQDYLAVGKPIIGAIDGAGAQVIEEAQCGLCVKAGDSEALARVIEEFIEHRAKYSDCGKNARRYYAEHFTKKRVLKQFLDILSANKGR